MFELDLIRLRGEETRVGSIRWPQSRLGGDTGSEEDKADRNRELNKL